MSVTGIQVLHKGWAATKKAGELADYIVKLAAVTDKSTDGPNVVLGSNFVPQENVVYQVGEDINILAIVKSRKVKRLSAMRWEVTVVYGSRDNDKKNDKPPNVDEDGNPTDDPLAERATFAVRPRLVTRALEKAVYLGMVVGNQFFAQGLGDYRAPNTLGAITNSALVPNDPPEQYEYSQWIYNITRPAAVWNADFYEGFQNSVNTTQITIPWLNLTIPPFNGRIVSITGGDYDRNGVFYFRETYEILVDKQFGFYRDILDRGFNRRSGRYDPDENGDLRAGNYNGPVHLPIKDANGADVSEPHLLNGDGQPMPPNDPIVGQGDAVYLRYQPPKIANWTNLQLDSRKRVF